MKILTGYLGGQLALAPEAFGGGVELKVAEKPGERAELDKPIEVMAMTTKN